MSHRLQRSALTLAALLQVLPLLRNIVTSPAASSSFAFILRWGIGSAATVGAFDACSGATNSFALPTNFVGTNNIGFTNKLTLTAKTAGDGAALCTILTNGVVADSLSNSQTTTNGMPAGLTFRFVDLNSGTASFTNVYCVISGTPTKNGTNLFHVDLSRSGSTSISGDFSIIIVAGGTTPVITNQPASVTTNAGSAVTFSVTAGGTAPLAYQWYYNTNAALAGATNSSLVVPNVQLTNAGSYSVTVANPAGSVNSAFAQLTVLQPPLIAAHPAGTNIATGGAATFSVAASGSPAPAYQWSKDNVPLADSGNISGSASNILIVSAVTTNDAGIYSVTITNALGSTNSFGATLAVLVPPAIAVHPAGATNNAGDNVNFSVAVTGTAPLHFQWLKNSSPISDGAKYLGANSNVLSVLNLAGPDGGNYSVVVTNAVGSATSASATLAVLTPPAITAQPASQTLPAGTNAVFSVTATGAVPLVYQWSKDNTPLTDGGNISGATSNILTVTGLTTNDAGSYFVTVTNFLGTATSSNAALTILSLPVILTQPASVFAATGAVAQLSVAAGSSTPLGYQWLKGGAAIADGAKFSGVVSNVLTISSLTTNDNGAFSVVITNADGAVTSSVANVSVQLPLVFTLQASNRAVKLGTNTFFRAAVTGSAPFSYQWFKNGSPLADGGNIFGSASNVLQVVVTSTNDTGNYFLTASNNVSAVASSNALLTVLTKPIITAQPTNRSVVISNSVSFAVGVGGTAPFSYQWKTSTPGKNKPKIKVIKGATNAVFTIPVVTKKTATNYFVVIKNNFGAVTSSIASLTVLPAVAAAVAPQPAMAVSVVTPPATGDLNIFCNADGSLTLRLTGAPQTSYSLEAAGDLLAPNWQTVGSTVSQADGSWQLTDTNAVSPSTRFYRVTQP